MKFRNSSIIIAFIFLVLAYRALAQQVLPAANTTRCDLKAQIACNLFKGNQGKFCALTPAVCYDRDDVIENKVCSSNSANYCQSFKENNGYLCTIFYCLITKPINY